jgi:hypothetical protein
MKLQELVPASLRNKYGNVFLGEYPLFAAKQNASRETNTEAEIKFIKLVNIWIASSKHQYGDSIYYQYKEDLQALSKEMPWLRPKPGTIVYRQVLVKDQKIKDRLMKQDPSKPATIQVDYNAHNLLQSWSIDENSSFFSKNAILSVMTGILSVKADDSFFLPPDILYTINPDSSFIQEQEVFRLGNEELKCDMTVRPSSLAQLHTAK